MRTVGSQDGTECEALVVGAGAVGLVAAIALAKAGRGTTLLGRAAEARPGRTVALLQGSVDLLRTLGLWDRLEPLAEPLRVMRIVDATGSLFAPPPVLFRAGEIGLPAFGYNIDTAVLETALWDAATSLPQLRIERGAAGSVAFQADLAEVRTEDGNVLRARLVVAADGRESLMRKAARIGVRAVAHPQRAMTAIFSHAAPHDTVSTEFHTREGPFTLVPLPGHEVHRSSLVWVMGPGAAARRRTLSPGDFTQEVEVQAGRLLGRMTLENGIGSFPIVTRVATRPVGPRLVLLGEAAHALPPIGAQGLNLSFRDVAALRRHCGDGGDPGAVARLSAYRRERQGDIAARVAAVDLLNGSLLSHGLGVDLLRGAGLAALGRIGPLRRFVMRHGLAPGSRSGAGPVA